MKGWVKIHRSMLKWEWWDDHNTARLWLYLLLTAAHEDVRFRGKVIKRGQLATTRVKLAEATGMSEQSVRTSLQRLKSTNEITTKVTNKFTIITICKFDNYQIVEDDANQQNNQRTNQQLTNNQPTTNQHIEQELKNEKNYNNISLLDAHAREAEDPKKDFVLIFGKKIVELWNKNDFLIKITGLTEKRKNKLRVRLSEFAKAGEPLEVYEKMIENIKNSDFLKGKNSRGWTITFDWLLNNENNWRKVYEGNYNNEPTVSASAQNWQGAEYKESDWE